MKVYCKGTVYAVKEIDDSLKGDELQEAISDFETSLRLDLDSMQEGGSSDYTFVYDTDEQSRERLMEDNPSLLEYLDGIERNTEFGRTVDAFMDGESLYDPGERKLYIPDVVTEPYTFHGIQVCTIKLSPEELAHEVSKYGDMTNWALETIPEFDWVGFPEREEGMGDAAYREDVSNSLKDFAMQLDSEDILYRLVREDDYVKSISNGIQRGEIVDALMDEKSLYDPGERKLYIPDVTMPYTFHGVMVCTIRLTPEELAHEVSKYGNMTNWALEAIPAPGAMQTSKDGRFDWIGFDIEPPKRKEGTFDATYLEKVSDALLDVVERLDREGIAGRLIPEEDYVKNTLKQMGAAKSTEEESFRGGR